jgi:hypothetical protein
MCNIYPCIKGKSQFSFPSWSHFRTNWKFSENSVSGNEKTRPHKPEKFCLHHLIYFEWFTLHNWLTCHKIISEKIQIWLFEQSTADRTSMMSLTVNELILVLLSDWDVMIPVELNAVLWLDSVKRFIKW